ncbi:COG1361 S-layer family protein [Acetobacterium bakii]|uniref:CARDB domain-containing protein n=1 Tax=Acetobacterium bakii TaxID=52689 RepID=A0A0L6TXJ6_9FIRM|nr:hypothetical protein [Acetobacterium bakii]KNZ40973.1 hypothetical protein AKG39_14815 [Acetobacterium bakii]
MKAKALLATLIVTLLLFFGIVPGVLAAPEQPLLQISSVTFSPETVSPGKDFKMILTLKNYGDYDAYNVTLDILSMAGAQDLGVFSMVGSGSHFYIDEIPSQETATIEIPMVSSPNAEAKNYNLNLKLYCESSGGTGYEFAETVGIFINESNSMSIIAPDRYTLGTDEKAVNQLEFEIANFGSNPVRGVQLGIASEGLIFTPNYQYYGTFEKDDNDSFTTAVTADTPGEYPTKITLKYLDSFNNERITERDITLVVPEDQVDASASKTENIFQQFLRVVFGINA